MVDPLQSSSLCFADSSSGNDDVSEPTNDDEYVFCAIYESGHF